MHLVLCGHFWSREDGSHTTGSTISEYPMLHTNLIIELELWVIKDSTFTLGEFL